MLGFADGMTISPIEIFFLYALQHVLFIGPAIYGYTQSLLNANFNFTKKQLLHFVPGFLYLIYSASIWIL
jgi:hypothetical protein